MNSSLLQIVGLSKRFGGLTATDNLGLEVRDGETHAIIGPNGAGKTTLIAQLAGALRPDSGSILFAGQDITRRSVHDRVSAGLARSFQISCFLPQFSALQNVALAVQARHGSSFRFWRPAAAEVPIFDEALAIMREVGLADVAATPAERLSHGEHRQLELALALATRPKLLLLDEPMAGMSGDESRKMLTLIERLTERLTVLLVEHDMDAVFRLADRISVLVAGSVIATGTPDEIRNDPQVRKAYLGDDESVVEPEEAAA